MAIVTIVIGVVLMGTGSGCFIASHAQISELQSEINGRLPEGQKFEPLFWWVGTYLRLLALQRQFLPQSSRPRKALGFGIVGLAVLLFGIGLLLYR
jgi:hypothetical protein